MRLVLPFKELEQARLIISWRHMLIWMVNKYDQFVYYLFIAILQCTLSRNIKVRLKVRQCICLRNSYLSTHRIFIVYALSLLG